MQLTQITSVDKTMQFEATDLEIKASLDDNGAVTIKVLKAGTCVHQLLIDDAVAPMEHSWIADLFAREDRIALAGLSADAHEYLSGLDIAQG